jgi:DNA-directed RNA polymerase specialized sigma24 family protein
VEGRASPATEELVLARDAVEDALAHPSRRQRECAVLALYLGFATDEVADLVRVRPSTVRVHLHAARTALSSVAAAEVRAGEH